MADSWGRFIRVTVFGESHGPAVGVTVDGLPAGLRIDLDALGREMARRAPGKNAAETARREEDLPEIVSGFYRGRTTGTALTALICNTNTRSQDYGEDIDLLRPGHADFPATARYHGHQDHRGGGHASARLTAGYVFAGALCKQYLAAQGVEIFAHIERIGDIRDRRFDPMLKDLAPLRALKDSVFPTLDIDAGKRMYERVLAVKAEGDSLGGVIECAAVGLPAGLGAPLFDSVESTLSALLFSVPAVKGVEFGRGFEMASLTGSACNDPLRVENGKIVPTRNANGGVNGGMTNGAPVLFRAAIRPTPSIALPQETVSYKKLENAEIAVKGRHDPCVVARAVPVIEAVTAIGLAELWKERLACP